jgi:L-threonylcarbamoyladenylate synthase
MSERAPDISKAASILRSGGLVAFPTETVYGLGADATNPGAIERIFAAKGRPSTNPLIVHAGDAETAFRYARHVPEEAKTLADCLWPAPLTMVLWKAESIAPRVSAGLQTIGLRVPDHPLALELLRAFGGPVAAPSANRSNHVSPTTADHVRADLGDAVDLVLDGGPCKIGIESTVLDLTQSPAIILRPGAVSLAEIENILGSDSVRVVNETMHPSQAASSPGQHEVHYSPHTPAFRFDPSQRSAVPVAGVGVVSLDPRMQAETILTMPASPDAYARRLYSVLRELEALNLPAIYIEMPPDKPEWLAIRDRLRRATRALAP